MRLSQRDEVAKFVFCCTLLLTDQSTLENVSKYHILYDKQESSLSCSASGGYPYPNVSLEFDGDVATEAQEVFMNNLHTRAGTVL